MAKLDLRVRLVGKVLARTSVARKSEEQILADQQRTIKHNPVLDWVLGGLAKGVTTLDDTAAGAEGRIPIRVYRPADAAGTLPLVVLIHGGGWTVGNLDIYDSLASTIARDAHAVVVSLEYRLAPTHPWPAAAEDCYAALLEVADRAAEWEADAGRLAVVGDSAGGNLAAVLTLMTRDRSGPAISFQGLIYPATDMTLGSASIGENAHAPILTEEDIHRYGSLYVPDPEDRRNPYASPLLALDHSGLPPALIQVAEHDPIRDDGLRYADALRAAGVPVRVTTYVGMPHGYLAFPRLCRSAPQALAELTAELRRQLVPAGVR
ncbi:MULTISPECIES: alpha/beta hydrolase [unclassified Arthrobacter]|uniref:alpha/beta hydrolase n=1 Tax=unclassified Arthrobacter TaxID=235627 RepID=UPI001E5865DA|nr:MULTISPECIES: alpha/beta hydrolase [unclassified Arthrobacter]MCC9144466.1 alpha/beta hydrolase [Arthrobacter sp. zg-Y919]MDK1275692.1 alpha/beta hydrolase [Arthrobacter sp. zg.Y919]WIB02940.1 alpha/beta hydrolase [Arthrobacter sp. zg-Y919]